MKRSMQLILMFENRTLEVSVEVPSTVEERLRYIDKARFAADQFAELLKKFGPLDFDEVPGEKLCQVRSMKWDLLPYSWVEAPQVQHDLDSVVLPDIGDEGVSFKLESVCTDSSNSPGSNQGSALPL